MWNKGSREIQITSRITKEKVEDKTLENLLKTKGDDKEDRKTKQQTSIKRGRERQIKYLVQAGGVGELGGW